MNFYKKEILQIKDDCYSNQWQIDTVIGLRNYINNNFKENLNLELFSRIRFVSKYHLLRLLKKYYGQTPNQYLIDKRIEKAKECIKNGLSISENSGMNFYSCSIEKTVLNSDQVILLTTT